MNDEKPWDKCVKIRLKRAAGVNTSAKRDRKRSQGLQVPEDTFKSISICGCPFARLHSVTLSLCHSVTLSLCHSVTLSLCYRDILTFKRRAPAPLLEIEDMPIIQPETIEKGEMIVRAAGTVQVYNRMSYWRPSVASLQQDALLEN